MLEERFLSKKVVSYALLDKKTRKHRISKKIYRIAKGAFVGIPIGAIAIKELFDEVAAASAEKLTRKVAWTSVLVFLPLSVASTGMTVYKITKNDRIRRISAFVTNTFGLIYTIPLWVNDHSILYFFEMSVWGEPVPLLPNGSLKIIP